LRGYIACRILMSKGILCSNLSGGYETYQLATTPHVNHAHISSESQEAAPDMTDIGGSPKKWSR